MLINRIRKILNKGQERTIKIKKNILLMGINKGISLFLSLLFLPLFLTCFDTIHYGIFVTIFSFVNWILFFDLGVGQGLRNKLAEAIAINDLVLARSYVSTAYVIVFGIFIILGILFLFISPFVNWSMIVNPPKHLIDETNRLIILVVSVMCINFAVRLFNSILLALQIPAISSYMDLISQGLCLLFIFLLSISKISDKFFFFGLIMTGIPTIITIVFSLFFFSLKYKFIFPSVYHFDRTKIKSIMMLGGNFFLIQIAGILLNQSNNVIIANISGPEKVAEYFALNKYMSMLFMGFTILITPFWSSVTEAFVIKDILWIKKSVSAYIKIVFVFVFIGIFMVIFSDFAFKIWIKNKITINFYLLLLVFVYMIIQMIWSVLGSVINGIGRVKFQLIASILSSCLHIPLAILLGRIWGAVGVISSLVFISSLSLIWAPYQYKVLLNGTAKGIWNK